MAIKHAAAKAIRKSAKNHAFNLKTRAEFKRLVKEARKLIAAGSADAGKAVAAAAKSLDKSARKRVIAKNTAARLKSRLMKALNKIGKK
jgi:small subunit ribosomal protein S20